LKAVENILWLDNNKKGNHFCVSKAKVNGFILLTGEFISKTIKGNTLLPLHSNRG
jgi:hypothetical protein